MLLLLLPFHFFFFLEFFIFWRAIDVVYDPNAILKIQCFWYICCWNYFFFIDNEQERKNKEITCNKADGANDKHILIAERSIIWTWLIWHKCRRVIKFEKKKAKVFANFFIAMNREFSKREKLKTSIRQIKHIESEGLLNLWMNKCHTIIKLISMAMVASSFYFYRLIHHAFGVCPQLNPILLLTRIAVKIHSCDWEYPKSPFDLRPSKTRLWTLF